MIRLVPGANPKNALKMISDAGNLLTNVSSGISGIDRYNRYLAWASQQGNLLSYQLHPDEVDRLVTTRRYWSLLSLDSSTVDGGTLAELVDGEMRQRGVDLEDAKKRIASDMRRWDDGEAVAIVLDTNVWLKHFDDPIKDADWLDSLDERPSVPLVVTVPMKVVDELDRHKRNRANAPSGGKPIRRRAGLALKYLEANAALPGERKTLQQGSMSSQPPTSTIHLVVLEQPLDRPPLVDADLEIIDRARSIMPYANRVRIVTTDYGMVYRSRQAGLEALRVKDYEEERDDQSVDGTVS
ncbi:PIN domain-containing protein [Arthrobacter sp. GAS37]|uniref:PIN domain-containing protein n=1 Tax=Arthrobacter sp. GAS37 TaxID=3156261 RepID=UPI00384DF5E7